MSGHLIQGNSVHQGREQEKMMWIWVTSALFQDSLFYQSPCTARTEINSKGPGVTEPGLYFNFAHTLILIQQIIIEDRILSFLFSKNRVLSSTIICWIKIRIWQQLQQFKWETNKLVTSECVCWWQHCLLHIGDGVGADLVHLLVMCKMNIPVDIMHYSPVRRYRK